MVSFGTTNYPPPMTYKEFKEMIEDQAALEAADKAAFFRERATISGGGDPDMEVTFVEAVPYNLPAAEEEPVSESDYCFF